VEREIHKNTSWDAAKFEVCGHKWVDMSEYDYGVSLLNDCKYGFNTEENILKLTVLKCGTYPNEIADQGYHEFSYAVYPHGGDYRTGNTVKEAYSFNQPLETASIPTNTLGTLADNFSFITVNKDNVIIDTMKCAEDNNDIIVRLYDAYNCSTKVQLCFGLPIEEVQLCDLMENPICNIEVAQDNTVEIDVKNYEITTLRLKTRVHM
jgi:alpha-mannosidase